MGNAGLLETETRPVLVVTCRTCGDEEVEAGDEQVTFSTTLRGWGWGIVAGYWYCPACKDDALEDTGDPYMTCGACGWRGEPAMAYTYCPHCGERLETKG